MLEISYSALSVSDAAAICEVHRAAFPVEYLRWTIFCSREVHQYIADIIGESQTSRNKEHEFVGAFVECRLVGYAHFRRLPTSWHLNQIAVLPKYQGLGIGRQLVQIWLKRAIEEGFELVSLDVNSDNTRAVRWYQKVGLRVTSTSGIFECQLSPSKTSTERKHRARLVDWDQTVAWRNRYGFATLRFAWDGQLLDVGWLCNSLRISDDIPADVLEEAISSVPGLERVFLMSSRCTMHLRLLGRHWRRVAVMHRMEAPTSQLLIETRGS